MAKNSILKPGKRKKQEEIVEILAAKYELSQRTIQRIISSGSNSNEISQAVFSDYMTYSEEHNQLLKKVVELVPFD